MFSNDTTSSFSALLKAINKKVTDSVQQGLGLDEFKSLSIGVDEASTKYPYLYVLPISEYVVRKYTKDFADVIRTVSFRVRTIKPNLNASFGQANGLANNVKNLFSRKKGSDYWKMKDLNSGNSIVFNAKVSEIQFLDHIKVVEGVICEAQLNIDYMCQIKTNTIQPMNTTELNTTNLKELTKIIYELISRSRASYLPQIKTIKYGAIEPISRYPAVVIVPDNAEIEGRFTGVDTYNSRYIIHVFTDFLNAPKSIYENLDIIYKIREIMFANKFLFHRSYDTNMDELIMGTTDIGDTRFFASQLVVESSSFEPITEITT